jgi:hypothetical protein
MCREDATYVGGERMTVRWRVSRVTLDQLQAMEVSVLWCTEGKGDEDLNVHHFLRWDESQIRRSGLTDQQSLTCDLPWTPLSYHGRLITVRWCARLRLFLAGGREVVTEKLFHLVTPEVAKARRHEAALASAELDANAELDGSAESEAVATEFASDVSGAGIVDRSTSQPAASNPVGSNPAEAGDADPEAAAS